ncbi:MAG: hypothetical protein JKY62_04155 [Desulfocapsa sp.]|nr:hypothetical protein [Desulfocapsa sp.]
MPALSGRDEDYQFHQRPGCYSKDTKFALPQHNPCPPVTEQEDFFDDGWPGYEEPVFSAD